MKNLTLQEYVDSGLGTSKYYGSQIFVLQSTKVNINRIDKDKFT